MQKNDASLFILVFLVPLTTILIVRTYLENRRSRGNPLRKFGVCLGAAGMLGFLATFWLAAFPLEFLNHVELPNMLGGTRLVAPDGRVFVVSWPISRVQRYGPEGFEKGFSYRGKATVLGISDNGNVLICTYREAMKFSPDGVEIPPREPCSDGTIKFSSSTYQSRAKVPAIALNWASALAVPLWHPIVGWLIALFGGLIAYSASSDIRRDKVGALGSGTESNNTPSSS